MADESVRLKVRVWYDEKTRHIKLAGKGLTASTVSNDSRQRALSSNLYGKLSKVLRSAGVPAPSQEKVDT
jgi:hypothetical protein